jgi:hypothetical protein
MIASMDSYTAAVTSNKAYIFIGGSKSSHFATKFFERFRKASPFVDIAWIWTNISDFQTKFPTGCAGVILFKDFASHSMNDRAQRMAKKEKLPMARVPKSWSKAEPILRTHGFLPVIESNDPEAVRGAAIIALGLKIAIDVRRKEGRIPTIEEVTGTLVKVLEMKGFAKNFPGKKILSKIMNQAAAEAPLPKPHQVLASTIWEATKMILADNPKLMTQRTKLFEEVKSFIGVEVSDWPSTADESIDGATKEFKKAHKSKMIEFARRQASTPQKDQKMPRTASLQVPAIEGAWGNLEAAFLNYEELPIDGTRLTRKQFKQRAYKRIHGFAEFSERREDTYWVNLPKMEAALGHSQTAPEQPSTREQKDDQSDRRRLEALGTRITFMEGTLDGINDKLDALLSAQPPAPVQVAPVAQVEDFRVPGDWPALIDQPAPIDSKPLGALKTRLLEAFWEAMNSQDIDIKIKIGG